MVVFPRFGLDMDNGYSFSTHVPRIHSKLALFWFRDGFLHLQEGEALLRLFQEKVVYGQGRVRKYDKGDHPRQKNVEEAVSEIEKLDVLFLDWKKTIITELLIFGNSLELEKM